MNWESTLIALQLMAEEEIGARLRAHDRQVRARDDASWATAKANAKAIRQAQER